MLAMIHFGRSRVPSGRDLERSSGRSFPMPRPLLPRSSRNLPCLRIALGPPASRILLMGRLTGNGDRWEMIDSKAVLLVGDRSHQRGIYRRSIAATRRLRITALARTNPGKRTAGDGHVARQAACEFRLDGTWWHRTASRWPVAGWGLDGRDKASPGAIWSSCLVVSFVVASLCSFVVAGRDEPKPEAETSSPPPAAILKHSPPPDGTWTADAEVAEARTFTDTGARRGPGHRRPRRQGLCLRRRLSHLPPHGSHPRVRQEPGADRPRGQARPRRQAAASSTRPA